MSQRLKLGEIVLRAGVVDELQLEAALGEQQKWGGRLGLVLTRMGFVTEHDLAQALAGQLNLPVATLEGKKIPRAVLGLVPCDYADDNTCLPLFLKNVGGSETLYVAMDDPSNLEVLDDLAFRTGMRVEPVVVATSEICEGIDRFYRDLDPVSTRLQAAATPGESAEPQEVVSRDTNPFDEAADAGADCGGLREEPEAARVHDEKPEPAAGTEPSTRLILHALTQILIEKGITSRDEFYSRVRALSAADEGDLTEE